MHHTAKNMKTDAGERVVICTVLCLNSQLYVPGIVATQQLQRRPLWSSRPTSGFCRHASNLICTCTMYLMDSQCNRHFTYLVTIIYLEVSEKFTALNNTGFKSSYSSGKSISASHTPARMFRQI